MGGQKEEKPLEGCYHAPEYQPWSNQERNHPYNSEMEYKNFFF